MSTLNPDFCILLGARALTSLAGILCIAIGNWRSDRQWDEQGSQLLTTGSSSGTAGGNGDPPTGSDYRDMEESNDKGATGTTAPTPPGTEVPVSTTITASVELQSAFPPCYLALAGWFLLALSYLFPRSNWSVFQTSKEDTLFCYLGMLLIVMIGVIQTVALRIAVLNRQVRTQRIFFIVTLGLAFLVEGAIADIVHPDTPFWMAPLGGTYCSVASIIFRP
jgi:hypothetical protein